MATQSQDNNKNQDAAEASNESSSQQPQSHQGMELPAPDKILMWLDLYGLIRTVSAAPTHTPRKISEQIILYKNSTTYRLYIYDADNGAWRYVALT